MKRSEVIIINGSSSNEDISDIEDYWNDNGLWSGFVPSFIRSKITEIEEDLPGFALYDRVSELEENTPALKGNVIVYFFKCNIPMLKDVSWARFVNKIENLPQEFEDE